MAALYEADLSASLPDYQQAGVLRALHTQGQKIEFDDGPVFAETIEMYSPNNPESIFPSTYWSVQADDRDDDEMSRIMAVNPSFNKILVKQITISTEIEGSLQVAFRYQKLYPYATKSLTSSGGVSRVTPELINELLGTTAQLSAKLAQGSNNSVIPAEQTSRVLLLDPDMVNEDNFIEGEVRQIDTFSGKNQVQLNYGAFFAKDLIVRIKDTQEILTYGQDYVFSHVDVDRTSMSSVIGGVYNFVFITRSYAGEMEFDYHAFGGEVQVDSVNRIIADVNTLISLISGSDFISGQSIQTLPFIASMNERVKALEARDMRISMSSNPDYSDSTNGQARTMVLSAGDTRLHWYDLAVLYTVVGSPDVVLRDRMKLRCELEGAKFSADVYVNVDMVSPDKPFSLSTASLLLDTRHTIGGAVGNMPSLAPQFRVIYTKTGGTPVSGAILQIGLALEGMTDTLNVEDLSGIQSCWILVDQPSSAVSPKDDNIVLPDGATVWAANAANNFSNAAMLPILNEHYLLSNTSTDISSGNVNTNISQTVLVSDEFRIGDIGTVQFVFSDMANENWYAVDAPAFVDADGNVYAKSPRHQGGIESSILITQDENTDAIIATYRANLSGSWASSMACKLKSIRLSV